MAGYRQGNGEKKWTRGEATGMLWQGGSKGGRNGK